MGCYMPGMKTLNVTDPVSQLDPMTSGRAYPYFYL